MGALALQLVVPRGFGCRTVTIPNVSVCVSAMYACLLLSRFCHSLSPCIAPQDGNTVRDAGRIWNLLRPRQ